jgi:hypothetical protein
VFLYLENLANHLRRLRERSLTSADVGKDPGEHRGNAVVMLETMRIRDAALDVLPVSVDVNALR